MQPAMAAEQLSQALVEELEKKPVWQAHFWVLADKVKWALASQTVQTAVELHYVHPTSVELQVLQIPDTSKYPAAHTQLLWLSTMNWVELQAVQIVAEVQARQPAMALPQVPHAVLPVSIYPLSHGHEFPDWVLKASLRQAVQFVAVLLQE